LVQDVAGGLVMAQKKKKNDPNTKVVADNRAARFHYALGERIEAGIALTGTEVKSLRQGRTNLGDAYVGPYGDEIFLYNAHIPEYLQANRFNHEMRRPRKLLLHRKQIGRLIASIQRHGMTIVPLKLYFNERGMAKCEISVAEGKKLHDKRAATKERDWNREKARIMKNASRD
jgi:SsrA-binding protein